MLSDSDEKFRHYDSDGSNTCQEELRGNEGHYYTWTSMDRPMIVLAAGTGIIAIATTGILDMSKGMVTMKAYAA